MLVLVQEAAEAVASVDLEVGEPVGFGDRFGQGTQWRGACESAVGPVLVGELLVLAQRVEEMGPVPMRVRSRSSVRQDRTHRSMTASLPRSPIGRSRIKVNTLVRAG
jgi:hypothetical protein